MAADPGKLENAHHLFLRGIPARLPKEEVEAALGTVLAAKGLQASLISVVPQSAWKNKGYGFVDLAGSPSQDEIEAAAAALDNAVKVGGKAIAVQVCQPSASGAKSVARQPTSWDQPVDKVSRLCAQILHLYFARRAEHSEFKAEKLLSQLSTTVAPSCNHEPKPVSLWGRDIYGSLEQMLLAIGDSHFGGGWTITGTIADRDAILSVGKARHMQGWDPQRDPTVTAVLRLATCKQRLVDIHTPEASTGFSTPSACRRCSDCGSFSAVPSSEQPSCSQSEASWSLQSVFATTRGTSSGLPTSSSGSELLTAGSSSHSLALCNGCGGFDDEQPRVQEPDPPDTPNVGDGRNGQRACRSVASSSGRQSCHGVAVQQAWQQWTAGSRPLHGSAQHSKSYSHLPSLSMRGRLQSPQQAPQRYGAPQPHSPATPQSRVNHDSSSSELPPSARDLLSRCARRLELLFAAFPSQHSFTLLYLAEVLSRADDVVAWGKESPFFSLVGYAEAVYGSFERLLVVISRLYFGGGWRFGGGQSPGEPRVLCVNRLPRTASNSSLGGMSNRSAPSRLTQQHSKVKGAATTS